MKYRLYIALSIFLVIILKLIPYSKQYEDTASLYYGDMLPTLPSFIKLCLVILIGLVLTSTFQYKQSLPGQSTIRQLDKCITQQLISIAAFTSYLLALFLLNTDKNIFYYFLTILLSFLTFEIVTKIMIRYIHPEKFSVADSYLKERKFFGVKKRNLETLEAITYDGLKKTLNFKFKEGLDNFKINLSEHSPEDIKHFYKAIVDTTGKDHFSTDSFYEYFINAKR